MAIKKDLNVLEEIKELNELLQSVRELAEDKEIINKAINELSTIIEDNKDEKDFKNIGIKVSKFNIEKYIKAKENFDNVVSLLPKINVKGSCLNGIKFNSIKSIEAYKEIQENINHRVNNYQMTLEKNLQNKN